MSKIEMQMAKTAKDVAEARTGMAQPVIEPKYDGWRGVAFVEADGVRMTNGRSGKDYTGQLPEIEAELALLPVGTILDGEIVSIGHDVETGRFENDWSLVQSAMTTKPGGKKAVTAEQRARIQFVAFDYLSTEEEAGGFDIARRPQHERRAALELVLAQCNVDTRRVTSSLQIEATQENHDSLVQVGFEGSIVKDAAMPYGFGKRGGGWRKIKSTVTVDVVVMELPVNGKGRNDGLVGHIVFGQYRDGILVQRGHCNPKNDADRAMLTREPQNHIGRVLELKVYGWSADDCPRHPTFLRWRDDRTAESATYKND